MKPIQQLATATTPDGSLIVLSEHDGNYSISVNRDELMNSRRHQSEVELARLGCAHVASHRNPNVLIGGLGMGYTLRAALDMLGPQATVTVAELIPQVVTWNEKLIGELADHPMRDKRVTVKRRDVCRLIGEANRSYDVILLDVDNGPQAMTDACNSRLYCREGIRACRNALNRNGCLAVWAASIERSFARRLQREQMYARFYRVPAYKGAKSLNRCVWVASKNERVLPELPDSPPRHTEKKNG